MKSCKKVIIQLNGYFLNKSISYLKAPYFHMFRKSVKRHDFDMVAIMLGVMFYYEIESAVSQKR